MNTTKHETSRSHRNLADPDVEVTFASCLAPQTSRRPKGKSTPGQARRLRHLLVLLKLGADPTRLAILLSLADGEKPSGALIRGSGQSQPTASRHLALMRNGRLVKTRRVGQNTFYGLTELGRKFVECISLLENRGPSGRRHLADEGTQTR